MSFFLLVGSFSGRLSSNASCTRVNLIDRAIPHSTSTGPRCSLLSTAFSGLPSTASARATGPEFTGLMVPGFGKIHSMYLVIKAVPRSIFFATYDATKNPTFSWSCSMSMSILTNSLTSNGTLGGGRRLLVFIVCNSGVHVVAGNSFLTRFGPAPMSKMAINVFRTSLAPTAISFSCLRTCSRL